MYGPTLGSIDKRDEIFTLDAGLDVFRDGVSLNIRQHNTSLLYVLSVAFMGMPIYVLLVHAQ